MSSKFVECDCLHYRFANLVIITIISFYTEHHTKDSIDALHVKRRLKAIIEKVFFKESFQ